VFNNNKKQFINILQQNKQLKINYKITEDDKIIKEDQSSFLISNDKLPEDAKYKINTLQKDIQQTYITSLFESPNQHIIETSDLDNISFDSIKIGNAKSVVIPKNEINSDKNYFEETGIDYIISPYTIIEEYLEDNGKKNSLNFLIYNDIIYLVIYNAKKQLSFSKLKTLTPFESTQDESFSEDDIVGQKVYEELNFLEIQQFLTETMEEYYITNDNIEFIEHIEVLYTIKPLSETQIQLLEEIMMIPVIYKAISLNNYMDEIVQRQDSDIHNFITPRIRDKSKNPMRWIIFILLVIAFCVGIIYYEVQMKPQSDEVKTSLEIVEVKNKEITPLKEKEIVNIEPSIIVLPNHINTNRMMMQNIQMLFDVIPYNTVLQDIEINQKGSTYVANFILNSDSLMDMQTKLKNIYGESKVLLQHKNKVIENTIIENTNIKDKYNFTKEILSSKYKIEDLLSTSEAISYVNSLLPKESTIKFTQKENTSFQTYNFDIISKISTPKDFFELIERLNSQKISINVSYPIVFSKTDLNLEVKYKIKLHQQLKEQVHTIK